MTGSQQEERNLEPTPAGCLLTVLSLAVLAVLALVLVRWRDPEDGEPLPRSVAILLPVLGMALFYGIGSAILGLFGLPVLRPKKDEPGRDQHTDGR